MPFSFPSSPSIGDKSTQNSREYEWSGYAWEIVATPAALSASVITSGTFDAARIANDAVTYAKLQNVSATDRLLGRSSAGSGDVEEITCTAFGRSLIDDADAAAARSTLSVQPTASPAFTGRVGIGAAANAIAYVHIDQTAPSSGGVTQVVRNTVTVPSTTTDYWTFLSAPTTQAASFTLSGMRHFVVDPQGFGAGSTVTNQFGYIVESSMTGATNNYGFYSNIASGTGRWNFYANGTAASYFGGQVQISAGSASACGVAFSGDPDTGIAQLSAAGANTLSICTNSAERVRVDASGRVGIGVAPVSAGSSALQVRGDLDIHGNDSDRTVTYNVGVGDGGITGWYRAKIAFVPSGAANNVSQHISFFNKDGDTGGATLTERMRIASDGKVYGYSVYSTTVGATNRDLFIDSGGLIGYVSSIRASKTGITAIDDVSWLRDLTPVSFHYRRRNEDGAYSDEPDGTLDYGLIAEDVEPVAPELCFYDIIDGEPQLRGVQYSKLITPMLRYIQQLEARIAALEERTNA